MTVQERPYWVRTPQGQVKERLHRIAEIVDSHEEKLTVRSITYKLYGKDTHGKDLSRAYTNTCKDVVRARVLGLVDWNDISEERVLSGHHAGGFDGPDDYLKYKLDPERLARGFRRDRTPAHERPIRVWFEKATVDDYFRDVCRRFGVNWICTRGQLNWTTKKQAAEELDPETVILYFGDNDEKGEEIKDVIERDPTYLAGELDSEPPNVEWAGITVDHEARFGLPSNSRLDGLEPSDLKQIVAENIRRFVDTDRLDEIIVAEAEEEDEVRGRLREALNGGDGQ